MSERTDVSALFALRLVADLMSALVAKNLLTTAELGAVVTDSLDASIELDPEYENALREITGVLVAQAGLVKLDVDRKKKGDE